MSLLGLLQFNLRIDAMEWCRCYSVCGSVKGAWSLGLTQRR